MGSLPPSYFPAILQQLWSLFTFCPSLTCSLTTLPGIGDNTLPP